MPTDYPDGFRRNLPGHTVDLESGFSLPWCESTSLVIAAAGNSSFTVEFSSLDWIYFVDMINVTPQAYTEFYISVAVNGVLYTAGANMGFIIIPLRTNPSINFIDGDSVSVTVTNKDASSRTFKVMINGSKILRPSTYVKAPGAYYTASPLIGFSPLSVTFTDGSAYSPTSWEWKSNGVDVDSTEQNPTIVLSVPGIYSPVLKVVNQYGYDIYARASYICVADSSFISQFTESDVGGYLSGTSFPITITNLPQNVNAYIARDYGVDSIDDYDIIFVAKLTGGSTYCIMPVSVVGNALPCLVSGGGYSISVFFNKAGSSSYKIFLQLFNGVTGGAADSVACSLNTYYYMRLVHESGSSTVTLYIYSDASFSTLVDTLSITDVKCASLFRYYYVASSYNNATTLVASGVVQNHGYITI